MGSGVSRVNHRQIAVTNIPDRRVEISNRKLTIEVDINLPGNNLTPHSSHRNEGLDQLEAAESPSAPTIRLHPLQSRSHEEIHGAILSTGAVNGSVINSHSSHHSSHVRSGGSGVLSESMNVDVVDENDREMLEHTAMSLGMDYDEFLFNVLYFGDGQVPNLSTAISNAREETVALHSENNTPYKLRPASTTAIERLKSEILHDLKDLEEPDCAICKENMEINNDVIFLPSCRHCFHMECLVRWIKLQGFCPVCRTTIEKINESRTTDSKVNQSPLTSIVDENEGDLEYNGDSRHFLTYSADDDDTHVRALFQNKDKSFDRKINEMKGDAIPEHESAEIDYGQNSYPSRSTGTVHSSADNHSKRIDDTSSAKNCNENSHESEVTPIQNRKKKNFPSAEKERLNHINENQAHYKEGRNVQSHLESKESNFPFDNDLNCNELTTPYIFSKKLLSGDEHESDVKSTICTSPSSSTSISPFATLTPSVLVNYYTAAALKSQTK